MKFSQDKKISRMRAKYNLSVMDYIMAFEKKQRLIFFDWEDEGRRAVFVKCTHKIRFWFSDIMFDINYDLPAGQITLWYEEQQLDTTKKETFKSYSKRLNDE